jgi:hypothetical protein
MSYRIDYVEDGLMVGQGGAWAWFRLPTYSYEALADGQRMALLAQEERLISGLREADCHLLVLPRSYPVSRWAAELERRTPHPTPGWAPYMKRAITHLRGQHLRQREVYLGIRLDRPPVAGWLRRLAGLPERLAGLEDPRPAGERLDQLRHELDLIRRRVTAARDEARLASAAELRWLVRRTLWRGMAEDAEDLYPPARPAWGGETLALLEGLVHNGYRSLRLGDEFAAQGHVAVLGVAHMPDGLDFPGAAEWLHHFDLLDIPLEASVRFVVVPPGKAAKDVAKYVAAALDQAEHTGQTTHDLPMDVTETYAEARRLEHDLRRGQQPLVYAWPRIVVAAESAEQLVARVTDVMERYRDLGFELVRPSGDQMALFLEAMPADHLRVRAYEQRMAPVTLAGSMYGASGELGDRQGPYLGQTTGISRSVVTLDPLLAPQVNRATAISLTGAPGGGKTASALLQAYLARLRGAWVVVIDPKAEATGLTRLDRLGTVQMVELDYTFEGLLDPFHIEADPEAAALLAAELCRMFLPPMLARQAEGHLMTAASAEAHDPGTPGLRGLLSRLMMSPNPVAHEAADALAAIARMPMARMCFGQGGARLRLEDALTVIQFANISLPAAGARPDEYAIDERLAVGLMRAVTALAGQLIEAGTASQPKMLVLDEAWAVTGSAEGQRLVERLARMGRSRNSALLLVSQNARDLMDERVTNCLSVKLAFRSDDDAELRAALALLDVEPSAEVLTMMRRFRPGECLMRDLHGRMGRVQVDLLPELLAAFDTTPKAQERSA